MSLLREAIFSQFLGDCSIVSLGKAKNGFISGINFFGLRLEPKSIFLEFLAGNSRLTCVGRKKKTGCEQSELLLLCTSISMIPVASL